MARSIRGRSLYKLLSLSFALLNCCFKLNKDEGSFWESLAPSFDLNVQWYER